MSAKDIEKRKFTLIILVYPFVLILISLLVNLFVFGVTAAEIAMPSRRVLIALSIGVVLLLLNHTWLMTSTELTRLKYGMSATPEERKVRGQLQTDVSPEGMQELERHHNAHRNATENIVYFGLLGLLVCLVSPVEIAAQIWIIGFAVGRLGHTFSYLTRRDDLRGIFMSISLAALYGLASYVLLSFVI